MSLTVQISLVKYSVRTSLTDALIIKTTKNFICLTSCLNFSNILLFKGFQEIFTMSFIPCRFYIVHQIKLGYHELWKYSYDMDSFIIYILVIILKISLERVLTDARTTLCAMILPLSWLTRVTSQTSSGCCTLFNIYLELFLKILHP